MMMMINSSLVKTQPSYPISSLQTNLHKSPLFIPYRPTNFNPTTFAKLEYHGDAGVKSEQSPSSSSSSSSQVLVKNEMGMGRRLLVTGAASVGFVGIMMLLGHDNALALGPEGPLMEEFWENVRRYFLYALTVSTGVLYSVFQPIYELLRNPISAILVLVIIGGTFYIGSQVLSAMVGLSDFDYQKCMFLLCNAIMAFVGVNSRLYSKEHYIMNAEHDILLQPLRVAEPVSEVETGTAASVSYMIPQVMLAREKQNKVVMKDEIVLASEYEAGEEERCEQEEDEACDDVDMKMMKDMIQKLQLIVKS